MHDQKRKRGFTPNKNEEAIRMLARENYHASRGRNRILIGAATLGILVLSVVFSISYGKFRAEYLLAARQNGTVAATVLERGTNEQYNRLKTLDYIQTVGKKMEVGAAHQDGSDEALCAIEALDETAWEELTAPAYTGIQGNYPEKPEEIMLSRRALEKAGIDKPEIGMKIPLDISYGLFQSIKAEFVLSGYFKDYRNPDVEEPIGYVSGDLAEETGKSWNTPDYLLILQKDRMNGEEAEKRLYEDIGMSDDSQRFFGGNTFAYDAVEKLSGGYMTAGICGVLILLGVYLLIQNVMSISMHEDIRQYGLLHILGTTRKQQRQIFFRQMGRVTVCAAVLGGILSAAAELLILPGILGNLYLQGNGEAVEFQVFHPKIWIMAMVFTILVIWIAAGWTVHRMMHLSPVEAIHYIGEAGYTGRTRDEVTCRRAGAAGRTGNLRSVSPKHEISYMAWRNLWRYPRRSVLTVLSLFLGITTALCTIVIGNGLDETNRIEQNPDFVIESTISAADSESWYDSDVDWSVCSYDEFAPVRDELRDKIRKLSGIKRESISMVTGGYMDVYDKTGALYPWANTMGLTDKEYEEYKILLDASVLQIVDEAWLDRLEVFADAEDLPIDMDSLRNGDGALVLHDHRMSPAQTVMAEKMTGRELDFARLNDKEWVEKRAAQTKDMSMEELWKWSQEQEETDAAFEKRKWAKPVVMKLSGFADTSLKGFPKLDTEASYGKEAVLYFVVSRKGFEKLGTAEKTFRMEFDVEEKKEPSIRQALKKLIAEENRALDIKEKDKGIIMTAKSELLAEALGAIRINQMIMGALGGMLILMGIMNYFNVMMTGMLARRQEFVTLKSIGMTGKQLRQMLLWEGAYHVLIVSGMVLTFGTAVLKLAAVYVHAKVSYFRFEYPVLQGSVVLIGLAVICMGIPMISRGKK